MNHGVQHVFVSATSFQKKKDPTDSHKMFPETTNRFSVFPLRLLCDVVSSLHSHRFDSDNVPVRASRSNKS